jgi:hypothetical protein
MGGESFDGRERLSLISGGRGDEKKSPKPGRPARRRPGFTTCRNPLGGAQNAAKIRRRTGDYPGQTWSTRLRPPATLSPPASVEFVRIVTTEEAQHFRASDLPLLTQYCEAAALAERAARELQRDDAEACWLTRWDKATRVMAGLSMRLRISPQARAPHNPTRPQRGSVLSHYEVMALERPNNDAD